MRKLKLHNNSGHCRNFEYEYWKQWANAVSHLVWFCKRLLF